MSGFQWVFPCLKLKNMLFDILSHGSCPFLSPANCNWKTVYNCCTETSISCYWCILSTYNSWWNNKSLVHQTSDIFPSKLRQSRVMMWPSDFLFSFMTHRVWEFGHHLIFGIFVEWHLCYSSLYLQINMSRFPAGWAFFLLLFTACTLSPYMHEHQCLQKPCHLRSTAHFSGIH